MTLQYMNKIFPFLLINLFCFSSLAKNLNQNEIEKIETVCQQSSPECLALLEFGLNELKPLSRQWFRFKQLRLFNLFDLQRWHLLRQEVDYWLLNENMPTNFAVYVYIYHAKLSISDKNIDEFTFYIKKAEQLLNEININSFSPLRLIEIANLQISSNNHKKAKQTLLQLENKFKHRDYPIFKQELYANLGHIALHQKQYKKHIDYRIQSLQWCLKTPNEQQIAIAYTNLAWAYHLIENFEKAEENYNLSITYSNKVKDDNTTIRSQMRLTQVLYLQGKKEQAEKLFNYLSTEFNSQLTSTSNQPLYQKIQLLSTK